MAEQNKEIEKIIIDILQKELKLPSDYGKDKNGDLIPCLIIGNQNALIGATPQLQIIVQSLYSKIVYNNSLILDEKEPFSEKKVAVINDTIQIDLMSIAPNNDARTKRNEVLTALNSTYSKQQQEKYGCKIFQIPRGIFNTSRAEGGSNIIRYTLDFVTQYQCSYEQPIDYYDTFKTEVGKNEKLKESEFTIKREE